MEISATLKHGPFEIEISAEEGEEYQRELQNAIDFIQENEGAFGDINASGSAHNVSVCKSGKSLPDGSANQSDESQGSNEGQQRTEDPDRDDPLYAISKKLRVPYDVLQDVFIIEDERPLLYLDDLDLLGDKKTDRQRRGSLILLYLWKEVFDTDRVKSSTLKDALAMSGINEKSMGNMYQGKGDTYFDRGGRGPTATVALSGVGEREARKEVQGLTEEIQSNNTSAESAERDEETDASFDQFR